MAVDESSYNPTDSLILKEPRKYYKATIHANHWQLRSLISSPQSDIVYFPSSSDVWGQNTKTGERQLITNLHFLPRCLVAEQGWICCGGETGQFATIRVGMRDWDIVRGSRAAGADSRLPLNLTPLMRTPSSMGESPVPGTPDEDIPFARASKFGEEIVNCVTLWFPPPNVMEHAYKTPVAVLSNNDRTVSILDLPESSLLETLNFPDCVNRSVMDLTGRLLITICDDPFMYVHCRERRDAATVNGRPKYEWIQTRKIKLKGQRPGDRGDMKGSFAAAFSPSGRYLAVGTQYGVISVFDVMALLDTESEPLITSFDTSRPGSRAGAVRDLAFSPHPFDLLAWTEDNAKFGVADLRNNFMSRQVTTVTQYAGVKKVDVVERSGEPLIDQRLRSLMDDMEHGMGTTDPTASEVYGRQLRLLTLTRELNERHQTPLTSEETEVLEALQNNRRLREAQRAASGDTPLPPALREFSYPRASNSSLRAYINVQNQERERRAQNQPARSASEILAAVQSDIERDSNLTQPNHTATSTIDWLHSRDRRGSSNTRRLPTVSAHPSSPWRDFDALFSIETTGEAANDRPVDPTARMRIDIEADERTTRNRQINAANRERLRAERAERVERAERSESNTPPLPSGNPPLMDEILGLTQTETNRPMIRQFWRGVRENSTGTPGRLTFFEGGVRSEPRSSTNPDDTTGCCWSPDGRTLYIGAENGLYEYPINVMGRKFFPSVMLR